MTPKTVIRSALLALVVCGVLYVVGRDILARRDATSTRTNATAQTPAATKLIVYYFSQGKECVTCDQIEAYAREAVKTQFPKELASGEILWRKVDVDEPRNEHYISEYELYTKSVVLVRMEKGKQIRWKNLEDVWDLVSDQPAFTEYVRSQARQCLDEAP